MAKPIRFRDKWRIRWTDEHGKRQSEFFQEHRDAVFKLREHEQHVEEVRRGLRVATPVDKTFGDLCDYWIKNRAPQKRSAHHDKSIIRAHLRPAFGELRLRDLGTEHVDKFLVDRIHLNKKTLLNLVTLLLTALNAAVDLGWLQKAPRIRKPKVRLFESDFSYLRTDEEIDRFLRAARDEGELVFVLYATALYTGMRAGELAGLRWDDVSFEQRLICVQRSYTGPTKAGDVRYVPILNALLPILRDWRLRHPGQLVFTNRDGRMLGKSARPFQEVLHRVLEAAKFTASTEITPGGRRRRQHYLVFHDLRHTFASHWMMRGGDLFKLQRILGHKSPTMTNRYAHLAPDAFVGDYGRLGDGQRFAGGRLLSLPAVPDAG